MKKILNVFLVFGFALFTIPSLQVSASTFPDVPEGHTFYDYVENLSSMGVVGGYSDGTFRPDAVVTRGAMAKFVMGGLGFTLWTDCGDFPDVPKGHVFYDYITSLKCFGVIGGFSDGTFRPDDQVTRGQAMKFIVKGSYLALEDLPAPASSLPFNDVPPSHTFYKDLLFAYGNDVVGGYSDGTFRPDEVVTRGAISKMITNAQTKLMTGTGGYKYDDPIGTSPTVTPVSTPTPIPTVDSGIDLPDEAVQVDLGDPDPVNPHSGVFYSNVYTFYYPSHFDNYTNSDALNNQFDAWFIDPNTNDLGGRNNIGVYVETSEDDGLDITLDDCNFAMDTLSQGGSIIDVELIDEIDTHGCYGKILWNTSPNLITEYLIIAKKVDEPKYNNSYLVQAIYTDNHVDKDDIHDALMSFTPLY